MKRCQKKIGCVLTLAVIHVTRFDRLYDVANLRHNVSAKSASSDKTAFVFDVFNTLHVSKTCNDAQ